MAGSKQAQLSGGCACGAVRFQIDGPVRPVIACHCGTCRKTSGHYWAATTTYRDNLHLVADRSLKWFKSSDFAQRGFCGQCGSSLFYQRNDSDCISIGAGCLDAPTGLSMPEHICTAEASDYYAIDDAASQQPGNHISDAFQLPPRS